MWNNCFTISFVKSLQLLLCWLGSRVGEEQKKAGDLHKFSTTQMLIWRIGSPQRRASVQLLSLCGRLCLWDMSPSFCQLLWMHAQYMSNEKREPHGAAVSSNSALRSMHFSWQLHGMRRTARWETTNLSAPTLSLTLKTSFWILVVVNVLFNSFCCPPFKIRF